MFPPEGLSLEACAWIEAQIEARVEEATKPMRQTIDENDDFVCGLQAALLDLILAQTRLQPELAQALAPQWREVAERFDQLKDVVQSDDFHETSGLLEPRKMIYRMLEALGTWPSPRAGK